MIPVKALLLEPEDTLGNGLASIRGLESRMIDITDFDIAMSDSTSAAGHGYIIKDNKVYNIIKTYMDLDKNVRIVMAKLDVERYDVLPTE